MNRYYWVRLRSGEITIAEERADENGCVYVPGSDEPAEDWIVEYIKEIFLEGDLNV